MEDTKNTKQDEDLGLGEKLIEENRARFVNRDGSFNVHRKGVFEKESFSLYHAILQMSWLRFYALILGTYAIVNLIFTTVYFSLGPLAFSGITGFGPRPFFKELFFFSFQIITTLGSSAIHPVSFAANVILALEAMVGMMGFALGAGLIFARFSNPAVRIIFSEKAVIAPYGKGVAFMCRIINGRSNELVDASATVTLAIAGEDGKRMVRTLPLERDHVLVFPVNWTLVHPIDEKSPLYGKTMQDLAAGRAEILVSIVAVDQDLSKKVYARFSYVYSEVAFGYKFTNILEHASDGSVIVDPKRIHEIEAV